MLLTLTMSNQVKEIETVHAFIIKSKRKFHVRSETIIDRRKSKKFIQNKRREEKKCNDGAQ